MKKEVPNLIRIESQYDPTYSENLLLWRYNRIIEEGYTFPVHDFNSYCALLLRHMELKDVPEFMKTDGVLNADIKFELINFQINNGEIISAEDKNYHTKRMFEILKERKAIIKKEITRTNLSGKELHSIGHKNSNFYRTLLRLTREFTDITLLDWFIPIVLTYERLIHIFVKHVEETRFGEGLFKQRTYFDYKPEEIWILLKTIIKYNKKEIQNHFLENSVEYQVGSLKDMKDFRKNSRNPIIFNKDKFVLTIDKFGYIKQFYQL